MVGWASGNFGLFGLKSQSVEHPVLNYIGVALAVFAVALYAFIKPTVKDVDENGEEERLKDEPSVNSSREYGFDDEGNRDLFPLITMLNLLTHACQVRRCSQSCQDQ